VAIGTFAGLAGLRAVFSPSLSGAFDGPAHFGASLTWVVLLCAFAPRILAPDPRAAVWARRITAFFLLVSAGYGAAWGAQSLRFAWRVPVSTMRGTVFLDPSKAPFLRSLAREIRPGERVLVIPEISAVDVLFAARNVSPLQDHLPGWLDPPLEDELLRRFHAVPPEAVVVFNRTLHEFGYQRFGERYGERLAAWIEENHRPVFAERVGSVLRPRARPQSP
jgi:endonuclease/exonuclease/phosphatase (EEP) superfamily protein YafD